MEFVFPVPGGTVTTGFWDLRPYSKKPEERTRIHRGWDLAHESTDRARIVAPEDGYVWYHYQLRCPLDKTAWIPWQFDGSYTFSHWYADTMGAVIGLFGESGYMYVFGHIDADIIFHALRSHSRSYAWQRDGSAYNNYIHRVLTVDHPTRVKRNQVIGYIGHSGYSTGYHTHMQVHATKAYDSRIDPAELWPNRRIYDNGAGPDYGLREGAPHIPPKAMDLDYMRGN